VYIYQTFVFISREEKKMKREEEENLKERRAKEEIQKG